MIIWYFNHYAVFPEVDNPDRAYYVSREFLAHGHRVVVFSASSHHLRRMPVEPSAVNRIQAHGEVEYICLPTRRYDGNNVHRLLNMRDFARAIPGLAQMASMNTMGKPDVIISSSPHPFSFPATYRLAKTLGAAIIYEVRDLWPLELIHVAGLHLWHPLTFWMSRIERQACRRADAVVSALPGAIDHLQRQGLDPARFVWIPNGVTAAEWKQPPEPLAAEHQREVDRIKKQGKLLVVYAGAQGPPNALDQILELNHLDTADRPYHFILIGDGVNHEELKARVCREKIGFVSFFPRMSKSRVRSAILQADVCFIGWSNRGNYPQGISPKKLGDYFMAAKPVIHAVSAKNDPVAEAGAGISVAPCAPGPLDRALRMLSNMGAEEREEIGLRGKLYALAHLEWSMLGKRYIALCETLIGQHRSPGSRRKNRGQSR